MKYFETPNHIMGAVNNAAGQGGMGQFWESENMKKCQNETWVSSYNLKFMHN